MKKQKFNSIDLCKLMMAFCVVAMHTRPLVTCTCEAVNKSYDAVVFMAVPFFFITSGFLLAQKMQPPFQTEENVVIGWNYLKKIIKLYLIWTAIYLPLAIGHFISTKAQPIKAVLVYIRGFVFIGEQYLSWHLWYLLATIYSLVLILFLLKKRQSIQKISFLGLILFLIGIGITYLTQYYEGGLPKIFDIIKTGLFYSIASGRILTGTFYISIGMMLSKRQMKKQICYIFLIGGFLANYYTVDPSMSAVFGAVSSIGLFGVVEAIRINDSKVFPFLRKMSTVIYFIHMYVWSFYCRIIG